MTALLVLSITLSAQTVLLSDGFENGKGSWVFSTVEGGNDYLIKPGKGYNSDNAVRSGAIGTTNFMISPVVNFTANKPYKLSFMAFSARAQSRKIEVYYNTVASLNGAETLIGVVDEVPTSYSSFTFNLTNPPVEAKYLIFKGIIKANKYNEMCIDNILLLQTQNYIPSATISQPTEGSTHTAGKPLNITVDAADSDDAVSLVKLFYRGEYYASVNTAPYLFVIPNLPIGTNAFFARAYDNSGDSITTPVRTITGVNNAPVCALTLSKNTITQGEKVLFNASPTDGDGEIASVSFFVNNERVATVASEPYQYEWSNPRPGIYSIYAVATDNTGLNGFSDTLNVNSAPTTSGVIMYEDFELGITNWKVTTTSGANDWKAFPNVGYNGTACARRAASNPNFMIYNTPYFFASGTFQVNIMAKAKRVNTYYLQAGLINGADTIWSANSNVIGLNFSNYQLNINNAVDAYYQLIIRAVKAGTSTYDELWIDDVFVIGPGGENNLPPVVKITSPANGAEMNLNTQVDVVAYAYDLMGSVDKVDFYLGNQKIGSAVASPYSIKWTPTYPGVYSLKAVCTDSNGATATSAISAYVNYTDRKVYDYVASSYLGSEAGSGKVWGTKVLSDGVIVLACDWGAVIPEGAVVHLLNGSTVNSRGTIVRVAADGKKILSVTKISDYAVDLSTDNADNIYVAAANKGMIKLNRLADKVILAKTFTKNVYRVDAGKAGYSVVLTRSGYDFNGKKWDGVTSFVMDPQGNIITSFGGASHYSNDVCIDETTQSAVVVGWRNISTNAKDNTNWLPVDIPGMKIFSFSGILKYNCYNWSGDPASPDWLNRSENNMADTRIARVSMGDDGLLYFMAEVSGGNHPLRYSPYDIMKKVRFVGGDNYHTLSNVGTEFHTFIGRLNLENGAYIEGQSFTARLSTGAGNTLEAEHGNVQADEDGRVYFTGASAYGAPLTRDVLPELAYSGGAFVYIMNPTLQTRELVCRVVQRNSGHDIAVRKFANFDKTIVYAGSTSYDAAGKENQSLLYLKNPVQNTFFGSPAQLSGFYAVIGGTTPAQYELKVNGMLKGMFTEGSKIALNAAEYTENMEFVRWSSGENYVVDSLAANTTLSMPGKSMNINMIVDTSTSVSPAYTLDFECFPNPTQGMVQIRTNSVQAVPLKVMDSTGKVVINTTINGLHMLDLSALKQGIYIVNVNNRIYKKLMIQH